MDLSAQEIRSSFLEFFQKHDHLKIPNRSIIPVNDPTLLFINSGMAPLKPYFTGAATPDSPRLCNVQPCIRTKDIDDVGDRHHLTYFEMMGSWSIGDYFKDRAVELAYELLVDVLKFPADRLYATVYGGNAALGLGPDVESAAAWERVGIPSSRIIELGEDNFWGPAGETGPCGPCTEVFFDTGPEYGPEWQPGMEFDTTKRYIEIWNAGVFMQLDKQADGSFLELPFKSVDTGSGLERMAMAMQGADTMYETDLLAPLQAFVGEHLGSDPRLTPARRRMTDHIRSAAFIVGEGVRPSNEGRGYIPRRLLRKCMAIAAAEEITFPFAESVDVVVDLLGGMHPFLVEQATTIKEVIAQECADFDAVIGRGLRRLDGLADRDGGLHLSGRDAFDLTATYGMPIDLLRELVAERGGELDEPGYDDAFKEHQRVSRGGSIGSSDGPRQWDAIDSTEFIGYADLVADGTVVGLRVDGDDREVSQVGDRVELVTASTPFYPEGGGQVGDQGVLRTPSGTVAVLDTVTRGDGAVITHVGTVEDGEIRLGDPVTMEVAADRRHDIERNHSATHLLNAALQEVLGDHVHQRGSLVESMHLRFDFSHPAKLTPAEIQEVELRVNDAIWANVARVTSEVPIDEARARGAQAMFGEKYGDIVRVVEFPGSSIELCGGAHVSRTGDIGLFRIVSEESVGKGTRRILALTGRRALAFTLEREQILRGVAAKLAVPLDQLEDRVGALLDRGAAPKAAPEGPDLVSLAKEAVRSLANGLTLATVELGELDRSIRSQVKAVSRQLDAVVLVTSAAGGRATIVVAAPEAVAATHPASDLLPPLLALIDGKGGGGPDVAQGGGPDTGGLAAVAPTLESLLLG